MSAFYRVQNQRDALEDRIVELELECRLLRQKWSRLACSAAASMQEYEKKVEELERENRLMRQQCFRRLEERDALKAERDELLATRGGE
tara:strand:- start:1431 stop:1697 length:267 start_codon:yes stop_codon:yes gene_type:complete